jgi:hypothetical protein
LFQKSELANFGLVVVVVVVVVVIVMMIVVVGAKVSKGTERL